ncbi:hypothetical protein ACP70R_041189 [Stipagrostis hirtigluma subsp. patula]
MCIYTRHDSAQSGIYIHSTSRHETKSSAATAKPEPDAHRPEKKFQAAAAAAPMSVGSKSLPARRVAGEGETGGGGENGGGGGGKKAAARYGRSFSGLDLTVGPGPLRDADSGRLKDKIRKWAKAVVAYARQLSFGSPRSSRSRSRAAAAARSATFPAKSGDADAEKEPTT